MSSLHILLKAVLLATALAACAPTAPGCTRAERRELGTIDRLIAETRANLERGYVTERHETGAGFNFCLGGGQSNVGVSFCGNPGIRTQTVAVDQSTEQRKLAGLQARREALLSEISAKNAACTARSG